MSHPVFLTSSHLSLMPLGSQNQWAEFFQTASFELEADAFIPILWFMLFKQENIFWAKYTDDFDINDERNLDVLAEYQTLFDDHLYAYLVVDQKQALINLENHKPIFIEIFGPENTFQFDLFKSLIEQHYPEYILLRTSGLALDLNDVDFLIKPLQHIENLRKDGFDNNEFIEYQSADFSRFDNHSYFFYGVNNNNTLSELKDTLLEQDIPNQENALSDPPKSSGLSIWISTAIVVILTLATWFTTHSILYAVIVFFISAFILGFISSKLGNKKTNQ